FPPSSLKGVCMGVCVRAQCNLFRRCSCTLTSRCARLLPELRPSGTSQCGVEPLPAGPSLPERRTMRHLASLFLISFVSGGLSAEPPGVRSEFIFEKAPFAQCHASTIVETKAGLVAAWFGGTREKNPDVGIWISRHTDGKWTAPVEVANG